MIIQDSLSINAMLKSRLESAGFFVDTVETGEEGVEKAKNGRYKLVLTDIKLPGMDGLEVARVLKKNEDTKNTAVILISARDESELAKCAKDVCADGYVGEPFDGKEFVKKIKEFIVEEEDLYEAPEVKEETTQLVVFRISAEWYGIEITKVKEVIKAEDITYLPSSPEYVAGIVNLRGNILSVTDLKKIFGLPQEELTGKSRLVVIESGVLETGLLVDEVAEAVEIPISGIDPALTTIIPERAEYIEGECKIGDRLIGILKVEKIF